MSNRKSFRVTEEEYKQIQHQKEINIENLQKDREIGIKTNKMRIIQMTRELEYRKDQIKKEVSLEKHEDFVDGKKPLFFIQNEIDNAQMNLERLTESTKELEEEYEKSKK